MLRVQVQKQQTGFIASAQTESSIYSRFKLVAGTEPIVAGKALSYLAWDWPNVLTRHSETSEHDRSINSLPRLRGLCVPEGQTKKHNAFRPPPSPCGSPRSSSSSILLTAPIAKFSPPNRTINDSLTATAKRRKTRLDIKAQLLSFLKSGSRCHAHVSELCQRREKGELDYELPLIPDRDKRVGGFGAVREGKKGLEKRR